MPADDVRLQPQMNMPLEIALLVKMLPLERGAELIAQFGNTRASEGRLDGATEAYNRFDHEIAEQMERSDA